ncbi:MAG: DUF4364 family protein [Lachnospiraceae bacterium]|nr:DUF4364 family protein [Lachnospiraceae bacterium]
MVLEPLTLYKLMILYLLKQVKFPMTNAQIADFFLSREYTTYYTLQQAFTEMLEAHLITVEEIHHNSRYELTREGEETLGFFGDRISPQIVEDMDAYLKENRVRLRDRAGVTADYSRLNSRDYTVRCEVREGKDIVFALDLVVPTEEQAELICRNWHEQNQKIYSYAMKELLK